MYKDFYKRPFGPIGYYALGIILSIYYFEYSQAVSNRALRRRRAYRFMNYIGKSRKRCLITQFSGAALVFFVMFIRYSSFAYLEPQAVALGRWPLFLNALFNCSAHYLYIMGVVLIFLPIFVGRLSIIRDIYAAEFLRPLARISYSVSLMQGLGLFILFFT